MFGHSHLLLFISLVLNIINYEISFNLKTNGDVSQLQSTNVSTVVELHRIMKWNSMYMYSSPFNIEILVGLFKKL